MDEFQAFFDTCGVIDFPPQHGIPVVFTVLELQGDSTCQKEVQTLK